jgi:heme/copper-type cytochrome/quinol oxidase subunit 2
VNLARIGMTLAMALCAEAAIHACPICFQIEDAHVVSGVRAAVAVLMGVTVVVVAPVIVFAVRISRRQIVQGCKGARVQGTTSAGVQGCEG